ncbi:MAG: PAAR domain-containing protein [Culturomica sp.]|jgi:hypothetical protein|nr:PAAR domain-containing protein [Culturomica sp.]
MADSPLKAAGAVGVVISHSVRILPGNRGTLRIECRDYAFPSTLVRKNKVFAESKDSDAIQKLLGDMCVCTGPPDTIVKGSSTVQICGKPAARMGDACAHGGSIVLGCPTVQIGG